MIGSVRQYVPQPAIQISLVHHTKAYNSSPIRQMIELPACGKQHYRVSGSRKAIFLSISKQRIQTVARQKLATPYLLRYSPQRRWLLWRMIGALCVSQAHGQNRRDVRLRAVRLNLSLEGSRYPTTIRDPCAF